VGRTLDQAGKSYLKWKARSIARQARVWTVEEIDEALVALLDADRRAKTGATDREALEELLLRLEVGHSASRQVRVTA
jgi:DNA polymerase III delta subunit